MRQNQVMAFDYRNLTSAHVRGARGLLGWSQDDLVNHSAVSKKTIQSIENDGKVLARTLKNVCEAFEQAGIEFLNDEAPGVRLHSSPSNTE